MARPRILVTSDCRVCPEVLEPLRRVAAVDERFGLTRDAMRAIVDKYDAVMCDGMVVLDRDLLATARRLRVVATPSTGTDHIDKAFLSERDIAFIALTTEYDVIEQFTATAEGAWLLLLAAIRGKPVAVRSDHAALADPAQHQERFRSRCE